MTALARDALLDRIVAALATDPAMSLSALAERLGVGRTTLHRHFTDRATLLEAVRRHGVARVEDAFGRAGLDRGDGASALLRLASELFALHGVLSLVFTEPPIIDDERWADSIPELNAVIRRGHEDGSIDPTQPAGWLEPLLWTTLAAGDLCTKAGIPRADAHDLIQRTLTKVLAPPPR
jgi:TetR/AcrR family transcriptional repressor of lfrA